jgi:hypothetical protein
MTRYARKVDANHAAIRDGLRALGWVVYDMSGAGDGLPDLGVSVAPGRPHFLEIKDENKPPSATKLTKRQEEWHRFAWQMTSKVRNLAEAIAALEWAKGRA